MKVAITVLLFVFTGLSAWSQEVPKDWKVTLERPGCFGSCPNYKITIDANGAVYFRNHDGDGAGRLSKQEVQGLFQLSKMEEFLSLKPDYAPRQECDGPSETDWPLEIISLTANGRSRMFTHDTGCKPRPNTFLSGIVRLGEGIDKLTDSMFIKN
jgi:hypothetical protein